MGETLPPSKLPRIKACLFDMDGLLIDSEDLYTYCTNQVLHKYGKPDLPWHIKAKLQGRPGPAASKILQDWAQLPITLDDFVAQTRALQEKEFPRTQPLPGVRELLAHLKTTSVQLAVATSSHRTNYDIKTRHLQDLFSTFAARHIVVGDDPRVPRGRGKPLPDIYLLALQTLNDALPAHAHIAPEECLVFEDSVPGVEAGRRAGMQVVWVPHPGLLGVYRERTAAVLAGLTGEHVDDVDSDAARAELREMQQQRDQAVAAGRQFARVRGRPGEVDDGWGRLYDTLEEFPYEHYGMK